MSIRRLKEDLAFDDDIIEYFKENPTVFNCVKKSIKLKKKNIPFKEEFNSLNNYEIYKLVNNNLSCIFKTSFPNFEIELENPFYDIMNLNTISENNSLINEYLLKNNISYEKFMKNKNYYDEVNELNHNFSTYIKVKFEDKNDVILHFIFLKELSLYINRFLSNFDKKCTFEFNTITNLEDVENNSGEIEGILSIQN